MAKEIERAGIPTVHICTIVPISKTVGEIRIVPAIAIPHPLGNPKVSPEEEKGIDKALSKADRQVKAGMVDVYSHAGKVGVLVELLCETDFVAKTVEFKNLAHELGMQVAAMNPKDVDSLLKQEYIRDASKTIGDLVKETIAKVGENIVVKRFIRYELAS